MNILRGRNLEGAKLLRPTRLAAFLFLAGILVALLPGAADELTPEDFLFERRSRIANEYMTDVIQRGDAATLIPALQSVHSELRSGGHRDKLEELRHNVASLITTTEALIASQLYSDNPGDVEIAQREMDESAEIARQEVRSELSDAPESTVEFSPPANDRVYNERKKDLLQIAYDMSRTLEGIE